jgi:hypothetical protein
VQNTEQSLLADNLVSKDYFLFLPPEYEKARVSSNRVRFEFGAVSIGTETWMRHHLRHRLLKISREKEGLFPPDLTDGERWQGISDRFQLGWRQKPCPIPLSDGGVAEVFSTDVKCWVWDGKNWYFRHEPTGRLVILKYIHHAARVRNLFGKIQNLLRQNPDKIVRVAKLLKLK